MQAVAKSQTLYVLQYDEASGDAIVSDAPDYVLQQGTADGSQGVGRQCCKLVLTWNV